MASVSTIKRPDPPAPNEIPPLEQGDHLTRAEFERRYDAMPHLKKAELIEGKVHMPSPVRWSQHASPHAGLISWSGAYGAATPGVQMGGNGSIRLDPDNMPQPDVAMIIDPACGGRSHISADDYVEGGPELLAEVAASTVSYDLHEKLRVYRRCEVCEYIVWRVQDQVIDWFQLREGEYEPLSLDSSGIYRSGIFPGLWLDAAAMTRFDLAKVLQVLQEGLQDPEHRAFVEKLQQRAAGQR